MFFSHPFRKLQWKIPALLALFLLTVFGFFAFLYQGFLRSQIVEQAASHSNLVANTIHLSLSQNMVLKNRESIQRSLRDIVHNPEIKEITIFNTERRVAYSSQPKLLGRSMKHSAFFDMEMEKGWKLVEAERGESMEILRSTTIPNRPTCSSNADRGEDFRCHSSSRAELGTIALRMSMNSGDEFLGRNWYYLMGFAAVVLVVIFAVSTHLFAVQVKSPIDRLLFRFDEVRQKQYRNVLDPPAAASDEIGQLSLRFEELVEHINDLHEKELANEKELILLQQDRVHEKELEEMKRALSARVDELGQANQKINQLARQVDEKNEGLNDAIKNISALNRVGVALSSELDIDKLVKLLINISVKGLRAEIGYIMLMDAEEGILVMKAWTGLGKHFLPTQIVKTGESICGRVASTGEGILLRKMNNESPFEKKSRFGFTRRSVISAPIIMKGRLLGVIELNNKRGEESFDEDDLAMMQSIANQAAVAIDNANLYMELQKSYFDTIRALVQAVEETDKYTRGHSERVTTFSVKIAKKMNFSEKDLLMVRYGGVLHDIGKIGIDVNIIQKPGRLTESEYRIVKGHPLIGKRIIKPIAFLKDVLPVVSQHHERYDGLGYPKGMDGSQIVPAARILAVADAYDSMITARPYRDPLPRKEAIVELRRCSGTQFDPMVVEAFLEILDEDREIRELEERLSKVGT